MPYCIRLLHADIFPQKLSRRSRMVILPGVSGVACTSTGTCRPARRSVSAIARSSPKFGSVTMTPSMLVAMFLEQIGAALGFFTRFDGAEFRFFGRQRDPLPRPLASRTAIILRGRVARQMIRKKTAIADDQSERRGAIW